MEPIKGLKHPYSNFGYRSDKISMAGGKAAKEGLEGLIEKVLISRGYADSYTITNNKIFGFPGEFPDMGALLKERFFGDSTSMSIEKELGELYYSHEITCAEHRNQIGSSLENSSIKEFLDIYEQIYNGFEIEGGTTRKKRENALAIIEKMSCKKIKKSLRTFFLPHDLNRDLFYAISTIADAEVLMSDLAEIEDLLKKGKRKEAISQVMGDEESSLSMHYEEPRHLNPFRYICDQTDSFWIARLVCPIELSQNDDKIMVYFPAKRMNVAIETIEELLDRTDWKIPYYCIKNKNLRLNHAKK